VKWTAPVQDTVNSGLLWTTFL